MLVLKTETGSDVTHLSVMLLFVNEVLLVLCFQQLLLNLTHVTGSVVHGATNRLQRFTIRRHWPNSFLFEFIDHFRPYFTHL